MFPITSVLSPCRHAGPRTKPGSSRSRGVILICGQDRRAVVAVLFTFSAVLWWLTSAIVTVFGALAASIVSEWPALN